MTGSSSAACWRCCSPHRTPRRRRALFQRHGLAPRPRAGRGGAAATHCIRAGAPGARRQAGRILHLPHHAARPALPEGTAALARSLPRHRLLCGSSACRNVELHPCKTISNHSPSQTTPKHTIFNILLSLSIKFLPL